MVEGAAYVGSWLFTKNSPAQWGKPRGENLLDSGVHFYETYRTADDQFMSVGCIEPQFYRTFLDKLGIGEEDLPQYENFDNLKGKVAEIFQKKTRKEWCEVCGCRIIPFEDLSRCLMAVMLVSPQFWASRRLQTFPTMQPGGYRGMFIHKIQGFFSCRWNAPTCPSSEQDPSHCAHLLKQP